MAAQDSSYPSVPGITIDSYNNVGIGKSPGYKLDVEGIKETAINLDQIGRLTNFRYIDESRGGLTARQQDGVLTETEEESFGRRGRSSAYIKGYKTASGKTLEEMKEDQNISQEEYDAFKSKEKENKD